MASKKNFSITKTVPILIYGAMKTGEVLSNVFVNSGYNVRGFIDKRADELDGSLNLPVYTLDNAPDIVDSVIILSTKNVFAHGEIANNLIEAGANNLIFFNELYPERNSLFTSIIDLQFQREIQEHTYLHDIPKTLKKIVPEIKDSAIIKEEDGLIVAKIPIGFILNSFYDGRFFRNPLTHPHWQMFSFFNGDFDSDIQWYIDHNKNSTKQIGYEATEKWQLQNMNSRYDVYAQLNQKFEHDPQFLIESAQKAVWSDSKHAFIAVGGRHRIGFLLSKGYQTIPLKIKKGDYRKFINFQCLEEVKQELYSSNRKLFETPIQHTYFYQFPTLNKQFVNNTIKPIIRRICQIIYKQSADVYLPELNQYKILTIAENSLPLIQYLIQAGFSVSTFKHISKFGQILNSLAYIDTSSIGVYENSVEYSFVFVDFTTTSIEDFRQIAVNSSYIIAKYASPQKEIIDEVFEGYQLTHTVSKFYESDQFVEITFWTLA